MRLFILMLEKLTENRIQYQVDGDRSVPGIREQLTRGR